MDQHISSRLEADLFLLHAPSVYDFRERDDMLFAYLSDSDSVNVTSIYEMYPIGWFSMKQWLADRGFDAKIVNVASLMLMYPELDVKRLLGRLEAPIFGFDLHWMTQCHGAIELAAELKEVHPDALTIFGGISATYFAKQLIEYPSVDVVVQGYDTLAPVTELVSQGPPGQQGLPLHPEPAVQGRRRGPGHRLHPQASLQLQQRAQRLVVLPGDTQPGAVGVQAHHDLAEHRMRA